MTELTLEELCKLANEDPAKARYIGTFIKQALLDEHEDMRMEAIKRLELETIAGYRIIKSIEADNEVLIVLGLNKSQDPRLSNPQLVSFRTLDEDYKGKPLYHFKINYNSKQLNGF